MTVGATPRWISETTIVTLHSRSLALHGGAPGLRDQGLLESALARPLNRYAYDGVNDIAELAATYAAALSSNRPFVGGNNRTAFLGMGLFLELNGLGLKAGPADAALTMLQVAAGRVGIAELTQWVGGNVEASALG